MKKILTVLLVGLMAFGTMAFAADSASPAEIYAGLTGKALEEAYESRGQGRFGQLAKEDGISEDFVAQMLEVKKAQIAGLVGDSLTQEEADALIEELEARMIECDGSQEQARLLEGYGMQFGQGQGNGLGGQFGNSEEGQGQMKRGNNGSGRGPAHGQGNGRGTQDGSGVRAQDGSCVIAD